MKNFFIKKQSNCTYYAELIKITNLNSLLSLYEAHLKKIKLCDGYYIAVINEYWEDFYIQRIKLPENFSAFEKRYLYSHISPPEELSHANGKHLPYVFFNKKKFEKRKEIDKSIVKHTDIFQAVYIPVQNGNNKISAFFFLFNTDKKLNTRLLNYFTRLVNDSSVRLENVIYLERINASANRFEAQHKREEKLFNLAVSISRFNPEDDLYGIVLQRLLSIYNFNIASIIIQKDEKLKYERTEFLNEQYNKIFEKYLAFTKNPENSYQLKIEEGTNPSSFLTNSHTYFKNASEVASVLTSKKDSDVLKILKTPGSLLYIPIRYCGEPIGMLNLFSIDEKVVLTEQDIRRINELGYFIGNSMSNAHLYSELQQRNELIEKNRQELTLLNNVAQKALLSKDFDFAFESIYTHVHQNYRFDKILYYSINTQENRVEFIKIKFPGFQEFINDTLKINENVLNLSPQGLTTLCLKKNNIIYLPEINIHDIQVPIEKEIVSIFKIKSVLFIPVKIENDEFRIFCFFTTSKNNFLSEEELNSLKIFISQMTIISNNIQLYEKTIKQKTELEQLGEASRWIGAELDFSKVVERTFNFFKEKYGFEGLIITLLDSTRKFYKTEKYIVPERLKETYVNYKDFVFPLDDNMGWLIECLTQDKITYIYKADETARDNILISRVIEFHQLKSTIMISLSIQGEIIGALTLNSYSHYINLSDEDIKTIHRFTNQIAALLKHSILHTELLTTKDSLEISKSELEIANEKLTNLLKLKDDFVAILSHDLKSPFSNIITAAEILLQNEFLNDKTKNLISIIHRNAKSQHNYTEQILEAIHSGSDRAQYDFEPINIEELLAPVLESCRMSADKKNIFLDSDFSCRKSILVDQKKIIHVVINLISNAIKYTNINGTIKITCFVNAKNEFEFHVIDNGIGIPEEKMKTLFSSYKNVSTPGTDGEKGTGLGLIICKNYILSHNGNIHVSSRIGLGSDFSFTIPFREEI